MFRRSGLWFAEPNQIQRIFRSRRSRQSLGWVARWGTGGPDRLREGSARPALLFATLKSDAAPSDAAMMCAEQGSGHRNMTNVPDDGRPDIDVTHATARAQSANQHWLVSTPGESRRGWHGGGVARGTDASRPQAGGRKCDQSANGFRPLREGPTGQAEPALRMRQINDAFGTIANIRPDDRPRLGSPRRSRSSGICDPVAFCGSPLSADVVKHRALDWAGLRCM